MAKTRSVGFTLIFYPESCPVDWRVLLDATGYMYVAILHDMDVHKDTGELKKAHYHILFTGFFTRSQKEKICGLLGVAKTLFQDVRSTNESMLNYFIHEGYEDNPEKTPYSKDKLIYSKNFDYETVHNIDKNFGNEINRLTIKDVFSTIMERRFITYAECLNWFIKNQPEAIELVVQRAYAIREYLNSVCYEPSNLDVSRETLERSTVDESQS